MNEVPGANAAYVVQVLSGAHVGMTFPLSKPIITIGRDPKNDLVLTDPTVSRYHARLVQRGPQWAIEKVAEQNTLKVNSRDIQQAALGPGEIVSLGAGVSFAFREQQNSQRLPSYPAYPGNGPPQPAPPSQSSIFPPMPLPLPQQVSYQSQPLPAPPATPQQTPLPGPQPSSRLPQPTPSGIFQPTPGLLSPNWGNRVGDIAGTERAQQSQTGIVGGMPSLAISSNTSNSRQVVPLTRSVTTIGRDPRNDIVIQEPIVSAFHAQIERSGDALVLVHPHPQARQKRTLNGLLYQGKHIEGDRPFRKTLARGDIFRVGDENGTLVTLTFNDGTGATQEPTAEMRPIPLNTAAVTIGRHPKNMVVLTHPQISAYHAQVESMGDGGHRIIDLGSTNHIYVNGQRVTSRLLKVGDEIRIGPYKLIYNGAQLTQYDESGSIRVDAVQLRKVGNNAQVLLDDITIVIPPRKFVAIVGGSGAGKSTLMDALNGLRPVQQGKVLYNGQDYYRSLAAFSTQLGYVPQDDIVHRDLTVERALYYAARLRLPQDFTEAQIKQRIEEVLADVEMDDRRDLLVHKLSGGQRKRVSIALELLANPSIFFLDEPTSGLDPGLDRKMMFLLRRLADKGHTIVLVTHATNNIKTCDYICFLAAGGRLAYFGPPEEAMQYFGKTDFAEIYGALEKTKEHLDAPEEAEKTFRASADYQKYVAKPLAEGPANRATQPLQTVPVKPPRRGDPQQQFKLLALRYIELLKNDRGNLLILLLQAPIIGLILMLILKFVTINGVFTYDNVTSPLNSGDAQKVLFVMSFAAVMFGCINGAREIVKELPIYRRERTVNLGIIPYMLSKIVVLGVLCLLQSLVLVVMVSIIEPFHQGIILPVGLEIYITLALASLAGLMVGLLISALAPNNDRAVSLVPMILIPQVIFAGTIFPLKSGPLQPFGMLFAVRWAMAALGSSIGLYNTGGDQFIGSNNSYQSGNGGYLLLLWFGLATMIVLLGFAIGYFLKKKDVRV